MLESLCPGTDSYNKAQFAHDNQQVHEKLTNLFISTFNQEAVKQKLLHNNPFMCSAFYWMVFDDGFVKMADLFSKTMMGAPFYLAEKFWRTIRTFFNVDQS